MDKWFKKYKYSASLIGFIIIVFLSYVPFIIAESLKGNSTILFSLLAISSLVISSILLLLYHHYFYKRTAKEFSGVLRYLLIGEVGGLIGLIGFLSEFVLSSLLAEYIKNMIAGEDLIKNAGLAITTFLNMFSVGFVFVYFFDKQLKIRPSKGREPRPVLIFALSRLDPRSTNRKKYQEIISDLPQNYEPVYELLEFHKDVLKEIHVLYSDETETRNDKGKNGIEYLNEILKSLGIYHKIKDNICTYKCDFNDEKSMKEQITQINIKIKKYEDKEVSIYISGGTSLMSSLLTLLALEKDRQIEYVDQDQKKLKDPNILPEIKAIEISKDDALLFLKTLALKWSKLKKQEEVKMNSQKLNLSTPNMLGGIGGIFIILGFLFNLLSIVGLILILVAFYQYSQILNKPSIFQYGLRWGIFLFVAEILLIFFVIAAIIGDGNTFLAVVGALLAYGLAIFAVINLKNVLIELSITLNQNLFDMSGKFIFWGTILLIILIGSVAVFIGYILLTIAFFTAPKEIELANNNVLNLDSTVNKS